MVISFDCLNQYGPYLNPMVFLNFSISQANNVQLGLKPVCVGFPTVTLKSVLSHTENFCHTFTHSVKKDTAPDPWGMEWSRGSSHYTNSDPESLSLTEVTKENTGSSGLPRLGNFGVFPPEMTQENTLLLSRRMFFFEF